MKQENTNTSVSRMRKKQTRHSGLKKIIQRCSNTLPKFGFNNSWNNLNLSKSYLFSYLINETEIESTIIKKANVFVSFKIEGIQLLEIRKIMDGATQNFVLKAYKAMR